MVTNQKTTNRSRNASLVQEIKALVRGEWKVIVNAIRRTKKYVSHELARIGHVDVKTAVWSMSDGIVKLCGPGHAERGYINGNPLSPQNKRLRGIRGDFVHLKMLCRLNILEVLIG